MPKQGIRWRGHLLLGWTQGAGLFPASLGIDRHLGSFDVRCIGGEWDTEKVIKVARENAKTALDRLLFKE